MLKKNRYYLITNYRKLNLKKKNFIFFNEFLKELYSDKILKKINFKYFISIKDQNKKKLDQKFLKNRLIKYRSYLSKGLNKIHNENNSIKYWGIIIDYYLIFLILITKINYDYFKIIKSKFKNFVYENSLRNFTFENSGEFVHYIVSDNEFLDYLRDKIISKSKIVNTRNIFVPLKTKKINLFKQFFLSITRFVVNFYISLRKPVVLINCYFGKKNSFKLFFSSFGKILNLPRSFLFSNNTFLKSKNIKKRDELLSFFKVKDDFDLIIRKILKDSLPLSLIENFIDLRNKNKRIIKIKKIGSAVDLYDNDEFKIFTAENIKSGGELIVYKHGGISEKELVNPVEIINSLYAKKTYEWLDKEGLGDNFLSNINPVSIKDIKKNKQILFFCSNSNIYERYAPVIKFCNHSRLNIYYNFYDKLDKNYKKQCLIRLFPRKESIEIKKIWRKKYSNKIKFDENDKIFSIKNSNIVILDDFSTPIYELIKMNMPFILVTKDSLNNFKPSFIKHVKNLKKIGLIYESEIEGAKFINKNFNNIDKWWIKTTKSKVYQNFKKNLFSSSPDFLNNIKRELINDL